MAIVKDWMQDASNEITAQQIEQRRLSRVDVPAIIAKHCPLKPNVAYMPVPRCETCVHWVRRKHATFEPPGRFGQCCMPAELANIMSTREDFGCVQWKAK